MYLQTRYVRKMSPYVLKSMLTEVFAVYSQAGGILTDGAGHAFPSTWGRWGYDASDTRFPIDTELGPLLCPRSPPCLGLGKLFTSFLLHWSTGGREQAKAAWGSGERGWFAVRRPGMEPWLC